MSIQKKSLIGNLTASQEGHRAKLGFSGRESRAARDCRTPGLCTRRVTSGCAPERSRAASLLPPARVSRCPAPRSPARRRFAATPLAPTRYPGPARVSSCPDPRRS